jgi:hypothetical protein
MTSGNTRQEGGDDDIARLALAMHDNSYFFLFRRGLAIRFSRDFNGSGVNRPRFSRHFPGSVNVAFQTLPVTAGC